MVKTLGLLISFGILGSTAKVVNFDTCQVGKTPPGWTVAMTDRGGPPMWEVLKDQTAHSNVLAQVSKDSTRSRLPLAIFNSLTLRDADVSVRIKLVGGHEDAGGGLIWRYRDANNYYLARANALANSVDVWKVENGRRIPLLPGVKHELPVNNWTILKVSARGSRFQVYLDHRRILEGNDSTFTGAGKVGLCTVADSIVYFDDFRVYPK
ncbi:MAG TPA: hypothetical protein VMA31_12970 [Bryobacteraceae bacterium]|nr:hypothetical protein [Bryobacteraceae bacterium]